MKESNQPSKDASNVNDVIRHANLLLDSGDEILHLTPSEWHAVTDEIERLTAILDRNPLGASGKHRGGSDVCLTCQCHCITADDDKREIERLRTALEKALDWMSESAPDGLWSKCNAILPAKTPAPQKHERTFTRHVSGSIEYYNKCYCGAAWPCAGANPK